MKRYRQTAKGKAAMARGTRRYRQTAKGKAVQAAAQNRYRHSAKGKATKARRLRKHPERHAAHTAVHYALRRGWLVRAVTCQTCGKRDTPKAHHYKGYAARYRLTVRWLCFRCHRRAHAGKLHTRIREVVPH